ncbi:MAG: hypothetical protein M0019_06665 [Actinomycetota bacterium]|nr:hypothetical protein [Actinomycetota bacterium]
MRLGGVAPFEDGATLSFVASKERASRENLYVIPRFRMSLLPLVALYGEMGAGKSVLMKALAAIFTAIGEASFESILSLAVQGERDFYSISAVFAVDDRLYEYVIAVRGGNVVKEALIYARTSKDEVLFLAEADVHTPIVVPTLVTAGNLLGRFEPSRGEDVEALVRALSHAIYYDPLVVLENREIIVKKSSIEGFFSLLENIARNTSSKVAEKLREFLSGVDDSTFGALESNERKDYRLPLSNLSTSEAALLAVSAILASQADMENGGIVAIDNFDTLLDFRVTSLILEKITEYVAGDIFLSLLLGMKETVFFDQSYFRRDQLVLVGNGTNASTITSLAEISELRYDRDVRKMYINRLFDAT